MEGNRKISVLREISCVYVCDEENQTCRTPLVLETTHAGRGAKEPVLMSTGSSAGSFMRGVTLSSSAHGEDALEYTKEVRHYIAAIERGVRKPRLLLDPSVSNLQSPHS